ncbi:MAG: peptidyl-tRNA hydrolase [Candidatus Diapherotrites archaeon]|nr:peptidyl-tRNA hydrolase [Candidatus Diapherotrites archaeon]
MNFKQVLVVRTDLEMGKGKIAAQCAHASLAAYQKTIQKEPEWVRGWEASGSAKVVLKVAGKKELLELFETIKKRLPTALIIDAGKTQIEPNEPTCIGIGPAPQTEADKFTSQLKLL